MQNDIELTRKILTAIHEKDNLRPAQIEIQGYDPVLVERHVTRLRDDGLIEGIKYADLPISVTDMTTAGHNAFAALKQKDIWNQLTSALNPEELAAFSMREVAGLVKDLAVAAAKKKLQSFTKPEA